MNAALTIRFIGNENYSRRYLLQRCDGKFYTGQGWSLRLGNARLYDKLDTAQRAYRRVMNNKYWCQASRTFTLRLDLTVRGSQGFTADDLGRYLAQALQLNFDNAAAGDGPNGTVVLAKAALGSLEEVGTNRQRPSPPQAD